MNCLLPFSGSTIAEIKNTDKGGCAISGFLQFWVFGGYYRLAKDWTKFPFWTLLEPHQLPFGILQMRANRSLLVWNGRRLNHLFHGPSNSFICLFFVLLSESLWSECPATWMHPFPAFPHHMRDDERREHSSKVRKTRNEGGGVDELNPETNINKHMVYPSRCLLFLVKTNLCHAISECKTYRIIKNFQKWISLSEVNTGQLCGNFLDSWGKSPLNY